MKRFILRSTLILSTTYLSICMPALAQEPLSELALFYRCFERITQTQPQPAQALVQQVKDGSKTAVQACMEVMNLARFTAASGTQIANPSDATAKSVLRTFHELHRSFAREKGYRNFDNEDFWTEQASKTWWDQSPYGSYLTRALFSPNHNVDSVTTGSEYLQPVRTNMSPVQTISGIPNTTAGQERVFRLGSAHPFAPQGELLGIRSVSIAANNYSTPIRFTNIFEMPDFANLFTPPAANRSISQVNFADVTAVRGPLAETTQFAIQITGQLSVSSAGSYTLFLDTDDAADLYIDGTRIVNQTGVGEGSGVMSLSSGSHSLRIDYRQRGGGARLILRWQGPGISKQVVPAAALSGLTESFYTHFQSPPFLATGNQGGGFLGNHNYLMTTFIEGERGYRPDGAVRTNRTWMRAVLQDIFGRSLPVVRESDVQQFVIPQSTTPFRQSAACTSCHATLDRGAGLIRGLQYAPVSTIGQESPAPDLVGILAMYMISPSLAEDPVWSDQGSNEYYKRALHAHLFFRNYRGALVDSVVRSFEDLGAAIRAQDDYYITFASRYYEYFLGIPVTLGDPGSPNYPQLNGPENYHRAQVIEMGLRLKNHKSLFQLIQEIISSPQYRLSDFGATYQG